MFKKGDKVLFDNKGTIYSGVVVGSPYNLVSKNEKYVEVLFYELKEELPVNIKYLKKVD